MSILLDQCFTSDYENSLLQIPVNEEIFMLFSFFQLIVFSTRWVLVYNQWVCAISHEGLLPFQLKWTYQVPFEEVPELVSGRRVFIQKGFAYVPSNQVNLFIKSY